MPIDQNHHHSHRDEVAATPEQPKNVNKFFIYSDIESFTPITPKQTKGQQSRLPVQPFPEQVAVQTIHLEDVEDKENINPFTGERANIQLTTENKETGKVPLREILQNQLPQVPCIPQQNNSALEGSSIAKAKTFR
jgi:hypothetical protein